MDSLKWAKGTTHHSPSKPFVERNKKIRFHWFVFGINPEIPGAYVLGNFIVNSAELHLKYVLLGGDDQMNNNINN